MSETRLSAFDCLLRGAWNVVANWQLVPLEVAQIVCSALLAFAAVLLPAAAIGLGSWDSAEAARRDDLPGRLLGGLEKVVRAEWLPEAPLLMGIGGALLVGAAILLVTAYFQAGIYGVLMSGERQAAPAVRGWPGFRTFSPGRFHGWAWRRLWRYLGMIALIIAVTLVWFLILVLFVQLVVSGTRQGTAGVAAIGCAGAALLAPSLLLLAAWSNLAMAELAAPGAGVGTAARRALGILGRRPGAVALLCALLVIAWLAASFITAPLSLLVNLGMGMADSLVQVVVSVVLVNLIGLAAQAAVSVGFSASLVALVHAEAAG